MSKILNPKQITGTTRFNFDFKLNNTTVIQLLKEFRKEFPSIYSNAGNIKLINEEEKRSMEICHDFISFFPPLSDIEAELLRQRIYKHIAKRSEVYFRTSKESLELSISSLLADDIRSCASLLYYSVHKFISGEMYYFLNSQFGLEDHEIDIKEVEHFTSANFYMFIKENKPIEELTKLNYKNILCLKANRVDPFTLVQYILGESLQEIYFYPYIDFICMNLFGKKYDDEELQIELQHIYHTFIEKKQKGEKTSQEEEVKTSIAYAILKSIEGINSSQWMFHALTIRLYWLRQTADYEFDFEVKTSIRELSILLNAIKSVINFVLKEKRNLLPDHKKTKNEIEELDDSAFPISKEDSSINLESKKEEEIGYYKIDAIFPLKISNDIEPLIFMTAVHLDSTFKKDKIISALNLSKHITNKGKYFIYEHKEVFSIPLYLHINNDGRWTFWIPELDFLSKVITPSDLIQMFREFLQVMKKSYSNLFGDEYEPDIIASYPNYKENSFSTITSLSLLNLDKALEIRRRAIQNQISRLIALKFDGDFNGSYIDINDLRINLNLIFGIKKLIDLIPIDQMYFKNTSEDMKLLANINILVVDNIDDYIEEFVDAHYVIFRNLEEKHNFLDVLQENSTIILTFNQLKEFLSMKDEDFLFGKITDTLNTVAYNKIINHDFDGAKVLNEKCLSISTSGSFPFATKGLWYLRNESISVDLAEKKGNEYYLKAIEIEEAEQSDVLIDLKQKYYYEMGLFYFKRKKDNQQAYKYINDALELGQDGVFYEEAVELLNDLIYTQEPATSLEDKAHTSSE